MAGEIAQMVENHHFHDCHIKETLSASSSLKRQSPANAVCHLLQKLNHGR
jgi:hypothetical protein